MKNFGLKLIIIICLILLITVIILVNTSLRQIPVSKTKVSKKEFKSPRATQIFELPPKEERPNEEAVEVEKLPEANIKDIPFETLPKKATRFKETAGETEPQPQEPSKELRTQPTPEELRQIKQRGLVIY